ncbi:MAG: acetyl-CoA carboxylase biotin carboxyl carrier protein [Spirochaetaceae bacterium]|nr:acetyl-CoA carboxylase biotin carboxyl carrier protein [Spirochaetaceae bacterium]
MDEKLILTLIDKFNAASMSELDFHDGQTRLVLRKAAAVHRTAAASAPPSAHLVIPADNTAQNEGSGAADGEGDGVCIRSPIVGVFYASSEPDAPPFVKAGSTVKAGQILCVLEAMKMMNKLEAEFDCEITAVKASNGDMVEYGQILFEVKPASARQRSE